MKPKIYQNGAPAATAVARKVTWRFWHVPRELATSARQWARVRIARYLIICMVPLGAAEGHVQEVYPPGAVYTELDCPRLGHLAAPIAVYPDALIAQILAAAMYSSQNVEPDTGFHLLSLSKRGPELDVLDCGQNATQDGDCPLVPIRRTVFLTCILALLFAPIVVISVGLINDGRRYLGFSFMGTYCLLFVGDVLFICLSAFPNWNWWLL